jgi:hypothetical protein
VVLSFRPAQASISLDDDGDGGTLNGWKYDDGMLKVRRGAGWGRGPCHPLSLLPVTDGRPLQTYDVKTDGSWPFVDDEKGLFINCQYSFNGSKLRPREGSGSKVRLHFGATVGRPSQHARRGTGAAPASSGRVFRWDSSTPSTSKPSLCGCSICLALWFAVVFVDKSLF